METRRPGVTLCITVALLIQLGCDNISESARSLEVATKNVEQGAQHLGKGLTDLGNIDPAAINKLLKENTELRQLAERLRTELNAASTMSTVYVGSDSKVYLEITGYKGRLRLSAWVDSARNKFIDNRVLLLNEKPFALDVRWAEISGRITHHSQIDEIYAQSAQRSIDRFLADPFVPPSSDMRLHSVDRRFNESGEHSIFLELIPEALDKYGQWEIEYKMYVQTANRQDMVTVGRMDSQTSKFELGNPLAPKEIVYAKVTVAPVSSLGVKP